MRYILLLSFLVAVALPCVAQDIVLPDGKAKAIVQNACGECHGLDTVVGNPMSPEKWRATVEKMVKKGATLSPADVDLVVDYLTVYFAADKVNVNKATSKDLQDLLQLAPADADAIIKYRTANGNFKDLAALNKVPGLDAKKLEAKKDLIDF